MNKSPKNTLKTLESNAFSQRNLPVYPLCFLVSSFALNSYFSFRASNASEVFLSMDPFTYAT